MAFSKTIREDILVASARHCCVCHKYRGLKIEVHHIIPIEQGGDDTYDNAIALCFDCHSDAGHYHAKHPKGIKLSPTELKKHKDAWFKIVKENKIKQPSQIDVDLVVSNNNRIFEPVFLHKTINFIDKEIFSKIEDLINKKLPNELANHKLIQDLSLLKTGDFLNDYKLDKIKSTKDLIEFLSLDNDKKLNFYKSDFNSTKEIQPIIFDNDIRFQDVTIKNHSICTLNLELVNSSVEVLEDFKVYLKFDKILKADSIDKRKRLFDVADYHYNVFFKDDFSAEFNPKNRILVQNDSVSIDPICFKTTHLDTDVIVEWRLLARDYNSSGQLVIPVRPVIEESEEIMFVNESELNNKNSFIVCKIERIN
jgi:hypothetical protein